MKRTWLGRAGRLALAAAILFGAAGISKAASPAAEEMNLGTKNIHVWRVRGNVYMLVGAGGNIAVQVGETYIIVVDTGLPQYADEVVTTIRNISDLPIIFIGNTSADADHTGGNAKLVNAGSALPNATMGFSREEEKDASRLKLFAGGTIVASLNTVNRTVEETGKTGAIGFGNEGFKIYNGEGIVFYKLPNGHTDGDSMCFFRASDVISAGDVFTTTSYPVIETENGGTVAGYIDALNDLIETMIPRYGEEGGTYVIPGHGHLSDRADVVNYRDMVTIIRARVEDLLKEGMTLEQIKAEKPTLDYDGIYGAEGGSKFLEIVYRELAKTMGPRKGK